MFKFSITFIFPFLFIVSTPSLFAQNQALKTLDEIISLMDKHYYDATYNGLDWKTQTALTRKKIANLKKPNERYQEIKKLLSKLGHSHLDFHPPGRNETKDPEIPTGSAREINFNVEPVDNKWVVTSVIPESDAWRSGLRPGFKISKLGKWETKNLFSDKKAMKYYYMKMALQNYPEDTISLVGDEKSISWKLSPYKGKVEKLGNISDRSVVTTKILPGNIGYVSFNIFLIGPTKETIKAIKTFRDKKCPGIIIDLRNNPGGIATMSTAVAKEFCKKNYNLGTQKGRSMTLKFPVFAQKKPYKGKVVILINRFSASTSEVLAAGVQSADKAVIIGETSAGMALPSVIVNLKDGSVFQYPIADFKTDDGKVLEAIGVKPDIEASHSIESLLEGKDAFIDAALKVLSTK